MRYRVLSSKNNRQEVPFAAGNDYKQTPIGKLKKRPCDLSPVGKPVIPGPSMVFKRIEPAQAGLTFLEVKTGLPPSVLLAPM